MTGALLAAAAFAAGPVAGANGRTVYFGSPGATGGGYNADGSLIFGTMTNTKVTSNGKTAVILLIRNDDGQTLNHVKVAGGTAADEKPYNPAFLPPSGTSLPAGATFAQVTVLSGPAGITCPVNSTTSFDCEVGSLASGASASFQIVIKVPASAGAHPYWFTGSWNEGWSSTGSNADYNFATDNLDVLAPSCDNGTASWFLGTETVDLTDGDTSGPCTDTSASVRSGSAIGGGGGYAQVLFDTTNATCPTGYRCYGRTVDVQIIGGAPVPGGVIWTIQFVGTKTIAGVIHYGDNYASDPTDFDAIPLTKKFKCSATLTTDCWNSVTPSPGGVKPVYVVVEFVTSTNGKGGGFY
jgi:hypothetical protein